MVNTVEILWVDLSLIYVIRDYSRDRVHNERARHTKQVLKNPLTYYFLFYHNYVCLELIGEGT